MSNEHSNVSAFESGLDAAYRATTYFAEFGHGRVAIRIDRRSPALDRQLLTSGCTDWAFVSACNPGSQPLPEKQNHDRHAQLIKTVSTMGFIWHNGQGVPDQPGWQPEPSMLILGIQPEQALKLAASFGQKAIVAGAAGLLARLYYVHGNSPR